jgi:hypothetical protein
MEITVSLQQANEPVAVMSVQVGIHASNFVQIVDMVLENAGLKLFFQVFRDLDRALKSLQV